MSTCVISNTHSGGFGELIKHGPVYVVSELETCRNDFYCSHSLIFSWNHSHSHSYPFTVQHLIPIPIFPTSLYSHPLAFPFPLPTITLEHLKAEKCVYNIGVARGVQGGAGPPPRATKNFFRHFCWNEAKMGLNWVRCTPADEIKR